MALSVGHSSDIPADAADTPVCVRLQDVALGDALDGLYSLLSCQGARWRWTRDGQPGAYRYTLWPSRAMANLVAKVRERVREEFVAALEKTQQSGSSDPIQAKIARVLSTLRSTGDQSGPIRRAQVIVVPGPDNVPRTETEGIVFDDGEITPHLLFATVIPLLDGPPATQAVVVPVPGAEHSEASWRTRLTASWLVEGDVPTDLVAERTHVKTSIPVGALLPERLADLSTAATLSLTRRASTEGPEGETENTRPSETLADILADFQRAPFRMAHKWRGPILLLRDPSAPFREQP